MLNNKIHPATAQVIKPIVETMTAIQTVQRQNPIINMNNEPVDVKRAKEKCCHIVIENGEYQLATKKTSDGKLICTACGREINTKFDKTSIDKLMAAIEVINQLLLFGLINGLDAKSVSALISMKELMPAIAQLQQNLNDFVTRENSAENAEKNLGLEYATPSSLRSITGY